jgi:hypothetical protein
MPSPFRAAGERFDPQTKASHQLSWPAALLAGAAGAAALTAVHQAARRYRTDAPRMDVLGMRALARGARAVDIEPPRRRQLYRATLAGDLVANTLYYAAVARSRSPVRAGLALGAAAGVGALVLPPPMGLGRPPHVESWANRAMTVAWYTIGGLVAGAIGARARSAVA